MTLKVWTKNYKVWTSSSHKKLPTWLIVECLRRILFKNSCATRSTRLDFHGIYYHSIYFTNFEKLNKNMEEGSIPMAIGIFIFILGRSHESYLGHMIWVISHDSYRRVLKESCHKDFRAINNNNVLSTIVTAVRTIQ